ncbi:MAG TPA: DUF1772 domain-containing protein [Rhabdaerophilum sp.]|nr:DUF1772 domain-containing protein [Rhabdaerophilum sp.]
MNNPDTAVGPTDGTVSNVRDLSIDLFRTGVLFAATLLFGLIAGFFYTYDVSVMRGFARLSDADFISAMQAVNATVRNPAFGVSFFGAAILSLLAAFLHWRQFTTPKGMLILLAALSYLLGALFLTVAINVPLNQWLAAQGPAVLMADAGAIRVQYEGDWVFWNLVRMLASLIAFLLMTAALWLDGRRA